MKWIHAVTAILLTTLGGSPVMAQDNALGPISAARPAGGPGVVVRPMRAVPLVALRLAVPVEESPEQTGATRVLQALVRPELEKAVARHGARVEMLHVPGYAVYTVVGPAGHFGTYVDLLRRAVSPPSVTPRKLDVLQTRVEARFSAELDTPEPLTRFRLRSRLFPSLATTVDRARVVRSLTPEALAEFWSRNYHPERMQAVVVGAIEEGAVLAAFSGWTQPRADVPGGTLAPDITGSPPEPQVLFPWVGLGYRADAIEPAVLAVATRLVQREMEKTLLRTGRAEMWWAPGDRRALVLIGTAPPSEARAFSRTWTGSGAPTVPLPPELASATGRDIARQLQTGLARAAALLTPADVAGARRALRHDILLQARTARGLAGILGEFYQRTGEPDAALDFLAAVDQVEITAVRDALGTLLSRMPEAVEVTP